MACPVSRKTHTVKTSDIIIIIIIIIIMVVVVKTLIDIIMGIYLMPLANS